MNCLNCNKEVKQSEGKRERKYCDDNCKQQYWVKNHKKEPKYVQAARVKKVFDKLKDAKLIDLPADYLNFKKIGIIRKDGSIAPLFEIAANLSPSKPKDNKTQGKEEKQAKNGTEKPNNDIQVKVPTNLAELKAMCPFKEFGEQRSVWISENRQKYNI